MIEVLLYLQGILDQVQKFSDWPRCLLHFLPTDLCLQAINAMDLIFFKNNRYQVVYFGMAHVQFTFVSYFIYNLVSPHLLGYKL